MITINICISALGVLAVISMEGSASTLSPMGDVQICQGQPKVFTCHIAQNSSFPRLEWQIDFQDETSVSSITEHFTSVDQEGHTFEADRNGINLHFNLTTKQGQSLVSVMKIMVLDDNGTDLINNATVSCRSAGEERHLHAVLSAITGPPRIENNMGMKFTWSESETALQEGNSFNQTLVTIQWNVVKFATLYFIEISPEVQSGSTFNTTTNSYQLCILNQEYNVSVTACNCAGNSTSAKMVMTPFTYNNCTINETLPGVTSINSSGDVGIGSFVAFSCETESSEDKLVAECMSDGQLHPDPASLNCSDSHRANFTPRNDTTSFSIILPISAAVIIAALVAILVISISLIIKAHKRWSTQKAQLPSDGNVYTHPPVLYTRDTTDDQSIGIYSLLQPEEKLNIAGLQSTSEVSEPEQDLGPTYADIHCTTPFSINNNISLQLDDDRVQYAQVKLQESHNMGYGNSVSFSQSDDEVPPPVPPKLANLDEEMLA